MSLASSLPLLTLGACGLLVAGAGVRLLQVDLQLGARVRTHGAGGTSAGRRLPPRVPRILVARGADLEEIESGLRRAGYFETGAIEVFVWLRLAAAALAALLAAAACVVLEVSLFRGLMTVFGVAFICWIGAKYVLKMKASSRERTLTIEFPFLLDLMLMMLESGVSLDQCFRAVAREERAAVPNHARLIGLLVDDLDRGQSYEVAFDRWARRVGVQGAKELAGLFRQSLFQGMELVPALRQFIREFSERRVMRARQAIGTITVRMVVLMLVFFMPALFIVLAGPPVAAILDSLSGAAQ